MLVLQKAIKQEGNLCFCFLFFYIILLVIFCIIFGQDILLEDEYFINNIHHEYFSYALICKISNKSFMIEKELH